MSLADSSLNHSSTTFQSPGQSVSEIHQSIVQWLNEFSAFVRADDQTGARRLFHPEVLGFGTRAERVIGLENLVGMQWQRIWPKTEGFHFLDETIVTDPSHDGTQACVQVLWESWAPAEGSRVHRRGRATILLTRTSEKAQWAAKHTHFSVTPPADPVWGAAESGDPIRL